MCCLGYLGGAAGDTGGAGGGGRAGGEEHADVQEGEAIGPEVGVVGAGVLIGAQFSTLLQSGHLGQEQEQEQDQEQQQEQEQELVQELVQSRITPPCMCL